MKKLILITLLVSISLSTFAQTGSMRSEKDWYLNVGVNAINSLGSRSPIYHPDDWAFQFPISAAVEFNWTEKFSIEQAITFNGFSEDKEIDGVDLQEDFNYLSLDTSVKYYFGQHIFGENLDWLELYANAGIGFYHIDETNISANLGGGLLVWVNKSRTFGFRGQTIGKFAFNHGDSGKDNNHYQYHLQAVFKL